MDVSWVPQVIKDENDRRTWAGIVQVKASNNLNAKDYYHRLEAATGLLTPAIAASERNLLHQGLHPRIFSMEDEEVKNNIYKKLVKRVKAMLDED